MASTATITGKTGTGNTMTAQQFTGVSSFNVDIAHGTITLNLSNGTVIPAISIIAATTFTVAIGGTGDYTITVS